MVYHKIVVYMQILVSVLFGMRWTNSVIIGEISLT